MSRNLVTVLLLGLLYQNHQSSTLCAQVHSPRSDDPWSRRAESGPDEKVPGWFYNLGTTGVRVRLMRKEPKVLQVRYVFAKSPASGKIKVGDYIVGAGGKPFQGDYRNAVDAWGADGPISEFAKELEEAQHPSRKGQLVLTIRRGSETQEVTLELGASATRYSPTYPTNCAKSEKLLAGLLDYLVNNQEKSGKRAGSFGYALQDTFAPLALLASGDAKYLPAVERNVRFHAKIADVKEKWLINWDYMSAAIVMSEYYLATKEQWVLADLQKIHDAIAKNQYLRMSQINPTVKKTHPESYPKGPRQAYGGWGHNPGFEGYGPIAMITGQGALAWSLMHRCGIKIDRKNHDAAYAFLARGTNRNGYVEYGDVMNENPQHWADMGRTGVAAIANFLSPYKESHYQQRAVSHARVIGQHPQSFPDSHASPIMGMGYIALGAHIDPPSFRKLMDANRWWFNLAQCGDGTFYYQPNRDNSGYDGNPRLLASSMVAFVFSLPKRTLVMTGKKLN